MVRHEYPLPPRSAETRRTVEARLREAAGRGDVRETLTVSWREQTLSVEVIDMPISDLYFNPATHRIRAQRSYNIDDEAELERDPWSERSQGYLRYLLGALPADPARPDPAFEDLRESLREYGQSDPGLISRDGILVNGNTRRAALIELGKTTMRVGILPESCTWDDIVSVELALQLRKDHRRDYSYINRLLAIEEQANARGEGAGLAEIARVFRTTADACAQDLWILGCIRETIERSEASGNRLRLTDFEDDQEKLKELRRRYVKEAARDKDRATVIKETRMAAIVLGFSKTDVRLIEADFNDRYLNRFLPPGVVSLPDESAPKAIPGLGGRIVGSSTVGVARAKALTDGVLKAKAARGDSTAEALITALQGAFEEALEPAGKDARVRKRKQAAPDRLMEATRALEQCMSDVVVAGGSGGLDEEAFDDAMGQLRSAAGKLAFHLKRSISEPGDNTAWLLRAAMDE